jgi:hypothetical protein
MNGSGCRNSRRLQHSNECRFKTTNIGVELRLRCPKHGVGVGGRLQRLGVVPHGTYYTCPALQSNGFDHPRPLGGVATSVVGASGASGLTGVLVAPDAEVRRLTPLLGRFECGFEHDK